MRTAYDIVREPIITERSMGMTEWKRYTFSVPLSANKTEIARAIETVFGVKVEKVNTLRMRGKSKRVGSHPRGRRSNWKKAIVTLAEDSKPIELFEGMV